MNKHVRKAISQIQEIGITSDRPQRNGTRNNAERKRKKVGTDEKMIGFV